ncbi:Lsr2 dimerization domain-containing protein [Pseudonocardia ammonioxydans]|uniref:Lsr2 dimerization domain-containing protein n=1 Tax=Pseudonocardia ammonioxydans TaxID=260086 RepID=UPI000B89824A
MTRVTQVKLIDDLDGSPAAETVRFSLDRKAYEIDLSAPHAAALRDAIAAFGDVARPQPGRRGAPATTSSSAASTRRSQNQAIRTWARAHGYAVPHRGRIPARISAAFHADNPDALPAREAAPTAATASAARAGEADERQSVARQPETDDDAAPPAAVGAGADTSVPAVGRDGLTTTERAQIRYWAQEQGIEVKPRGQLKHDLISNYRAWAKRVGSGIATS